MGVPGIECFDWTTAAVDRLKALYADGLSAGQIAAELACGVSRNAVIGKVHRLGLQRRGRATSVRKPQQPQRLAPRAEAGVVRRIGAKARAENDPHKFEAEIAVDLPADQSPDAVRFLARHKTQCAWPLNAVTPIDLHMVCGAAPADDQSYCRRHHRLSIQAYRPRDMTDEERGRRRASALKRHKERERDLASA